MSSPLSTVKQSYPTLTKNGMTAKKNQKCKHMTKKDAFTCLAFRKEYLPTFNQIKNYCLCNNHNQCPFYTMAQWCSIDYY